MVTLHLTFTLVIWVVMEWYCG